MVETVGYSPGPCLAHRELCYKHALYYTLTRLSCILTTHQSYFNHFILTHTCIPSPDITIDPSSASADVFEFVRHFINIVIFIILAPSFGDYIQKKKKKNQCYEYIIHDNYSVGLDKNTNNFMQ